jgi:thioredoxin reductase
MAFTQKNAAEQYKPVDWSNYPAPFGKTASAVGKYISNMVPQTGEQWARSAGIPTQAPTTPEGIKQWMGLWFPPLRQSMDFPEQVINRAQQIHEADQTPAGSQERYDVGIGTVLDLAQLAGLKAMGDVARPGIPKPGAVPPPPGIFNPADFESSVGEVKFQEPIPGPPIPGPGTEPLAKPPIQTQEIPGVQPYAKQPGDAQVQGGGTALGQQARPDGSIPIPGDSDYVVGTPQGAAAGGQLPRTEPVPNAAPVVSEAPKATPGQIGGWERRVKEAQHEIDLLKNVPDMPPERIQERQAEIDHLNKQIAGDLPPDALPPLPASSKGGVEKRIGEMYAAKTPEEQQRILDQNMGTAPRHEPAPITFPTDEDIFNQTKIGPERERAITERRQQVEYAASQLQPGDIIEAPHGGRYVVDRPMTKVPGGVLVRPEGDPNAVSQEYQLTHDDRIYKIAKKVAEEAAKGAPQQAKEADTDVVRLKALQKEISDIYKRGERPSILKTQERDALVKAIEDKAKAEGGPSTPEQLRAKQLDDELHDLRIENTARIARGEDPLPIPVEKTHELGRLLSGERREGRDASGKIIKTTEPTKLQPEEQVQLHQLEDDAAGLQNAVLRYEKLSESRRITREERQDWGDKQQALWDNFREQHKLWEKSGQNYDVVVVGIGAAGSKMLGHLPYEGLRVLGIEAGARAGGAAKESLELFNVGRGARGSTGRDYFNAKIETARNGGAEIRTNTEVVNIIDQPDGSVHVITGERRGNALVNIKTIPASRVALFPGTKPAIRPYPGSQYTGWASTERFKNLTNGKEGMVYGGSNAVTQAVLGSLDLGTKKVTVVTRHKFGPEASINQDRRILDHVSKGNVELVTGTIDHVTANPDGSRTVHVGPSEDNPRADYTFKVAHVENFLGGENNTAWLPKGITLVKVGKKGGFVETLGDGSRRTKMPGVFVGGDVRAPIPGETKGYRIDLAEGDATAIGLTIQDEIGHFRQTGKLPEWKVSEAEIHQIDEELKLMKGMKPHEADLESGEKDGTPGSQAQSSGTTFDPSSRSTKLDWTQKSAEPTRPEREVPIPPGGLEFQKPKPPPQPPVPGIAKHLSSIPQQQPQQQGSQTAGGDIIPFVPPRAGGKAAPPPVSPLREMINAKAMGDFNKAYKLAQQFKEEALASRKRMIDGWQKDVGPKTYSQAQADAAIAKINAMPLVPPEVEQVLRDRAAYLEKQGIGIKKPDRDQLTAHKVTPPKTAREIPLVVDPETRMQELSTMSDAGLKGSLDNGDITKAEHDEAMYRKLQQKHTKFENASGPPLSPREWEQFVNLRDDSEMRRFKEAQAFFQQRAGRPQSFSVPDMLDEANRGHPFPGRDLNPPDIEGEFIKLKPRLALPAPPDTATHATGYPISEVPLNKISLSKDVPQFKSGANEQGVVEPLAGKYERVGTPPVQLWERRNGKLELISGRHRFDLAKRTGEKTIPSQIHREVNGFDARQAARLDAELNIRDNQGSVADYANYFRNSGITQQAAESRGLLARGTGKAGFSIARGSGESLFGLHQSGRISDAQAQAIAEAAPGNEGLQRVGIKAALGGESGQSVGNLIRGVRANLGGHPHSHQLDLLSSDDTAMQAMADAGKRASALQRELNQHISSVAGAARHPEKARALGVNVENQADVAHKLAELRSLADRAKHWDMDPQMRDMILKGDMTPSRMVEALSPTTRAVAAKEPVPTVETEPRRPPIGWHESLTQGREWLAAGGDIKGVVDNFHKTGKVTAADMGKARAHLDDLQAATNEAGDALMKHPHDADLERKFNAAQRAEEDFTNAYRPMDAVARDTLKTLDGSAPIDPRTASSFTGLMRRFREIRGRESMVPEEAEARQIADKTTKAQSQYMKDTAELYNSIDNELGRIKTDRKGPATIDTATKGISKKRKPC